MKSVTETMEQFPQELEQSYKKREYQKFTLNGKEYNVVNVKSKEELETAESFILADPEGIIADTYYKTPYGKAKDSERRLMKSSLARYIEIHTFERYKTPEKWQEYIKRSAMNFVDNPEGWFVLLGQSGSGKTMICNAIAISLMRKGKTLEYMLWFDEINRIKFNMQENESFIKNLETPDVLYIDDFLKTKKGAEPSNAEIGLAFQVLDTRYRSGKLTIISSEKSMEELKHYDTAVYGRIAEMGKDNVLCIGDDDTRNWREAQLIKE